MDEGHALFFMRTGGAMAIGLALEQNAPLIGLVYSGKGFDQRGFARAIFAEQGQNLAFAKRKRHTFECDSSAETLDDIFECNKWR